jgi:hypothetical protein
MQIARDCISPLPTSASSHTQNRMPASENSSAKCTDLRRHQENISLHTCPSVHRSSQLRVSGKSCLSVSPNRGFTSDPLRAARPLSSRPPSKMLILKMATAIPISVVQLLSYSPYSLIYLGSSTYITHNHNVYIYICIYWGAGIAQSA